MVEIAKAALWAAASFFIAVPFMRRFRAPIAAFIERPRKVSARGLGVEVADASSQAATGGPPITADPLRAVVEPSPSAGTEPARGAGTPSTARTSAEAPHQVILGGWNSPLVITAERRIKDDLKARGVTEATDQSAALAHLLAVAAVQVDFESTCADIWRSQIVVLRAG